jgi:spermidine synthase
VSVALSFAMFASGAAALLFQTLWFRQVGLVVGNGVWASSLTLAAFMAGLAVGNAVVARGGHRITRPVWLYAVLEGLVGVVGIGIVVILPSLAEGLAGIWQLLASWPIALNGMRLAISFVVLVVPSIAMGATLPLLVKTLVEHDPRFGSALGRLYGWNTLGAVVGALVGEMFLVEWFGVVGASFVAGCLNGLAAVVALQLTRRIGERVDGSTGSPPRALRWPAGVGWPLFAVFLSGGMILALEVVWFRFLELFVWNSGTSFALMLAVVLAGIGLGGRVAGAWLGARPDADRFATPVALLAGAFTIAGYSGFSTVFGWLMGPASTELVLDDGAILALAGALTLPVAFLSGVFFTFVGNQLQRRFGEEIQTTGVLTLANTLGGALGALAGGFVLLPLLGMERALFGIGALYAVPAVAMLAGGSHPRLPRAVWQLAWAAPLVVAVALFPFGAMRSEHLARVAASFGLGDADAVAVARDTRTETLLLLRRRFLGETLSHLLVTGGFGMASTDEWSRRYMKQFVYLPLNLHPDPRSALLISFGSGSTAVALRDVESLRTIDIVDISRDVLAVSDEIYPDPDRHPLKDDRVTTHVGDGRFHLLSTERRYDLITSEPPPPKHAGVVNLYTRDFFELVRARLTDGGINTHWLPSHALTVDDAKAIVAAYCEVFPDCTLWKGINLNWTLMGSRNADWTTSESEFLARWEAMDAAREGRALGVERPEQLGAMFLGDARVLKEWVADVPPLTDWYPKRLVDDPPTPDDYDRLRLWTDPERTRERFEQSDFIARHWPEPLRETTPDYFRYDGLVNDVFLEAFGSPPRLARTIGTIDRVIAETDLEQLPMWLLGAHGDYLAVIDAHPELRSRPIALHMLGRRALAQRRFDLASSIFRHLPSPTPESVLLDAYASASDERKDDAARLIQAGRAAEATLPWDLLVERFALGDAGNGGDGAKNGADDMPDAAGG